MPNRREFVIGRWYHIALAPRLVIRTVDAHVKAGGDWREMFANPAPGSTWEEYRAALLARGDRPLIIGDCDNVAADGCCGGHERENDL